MLCLQCRLSYIISNTQVFEKRTKEDAEGRLRKPKWDLLRKRRLKWCHALLFQEKMKSKAHEENQEQHDLQFLPSIPLSFSTLIIFSSRHPLLPKSLSTLERRHTEYWELCVCVSYHLLCVRKVLTQEARKMRRKQMRLRSTLLPAIMTLVLLSFDSSIPVSSSTLRATLTRCETQYRQLSKSQHKDGQNVVFEREDASLNSSSSSSSSSSSPGSLSERLAG